MKRIVIAILLLLMSVGIRAEQGALEAVADPALKENCYSMLARSGDADGMFQLAILYLKEQERFPGKEEAIISYLRAAANKQHREALFVMAQLHENGSPELGVQRDYDWAMSTYRWLASQGHAAARLRMSVEQAQPPVQAADTTQRLVEQLEQQQQQQRQSLPSPTAIRLEIANVSASIRETEYKLRQKQSDMERKEAREFNAQELGRYTGLATLKISQYATDTKTVRLYQQQLRQLEAKRIKLEELLARAESQQSAPASSTPVEPDPDAGAKRGVKFCTACGAKASTSGKFCSQCGNRLAN